MRERAHLTSVGLILLNLYLAGVSAEPVKFSPPVLTPPRKDVRPFEYVKAKVPVYRVGGQTATISQMQKPLDPEESKKHFVHPQHLDIQLVLAEPDLGGKPIAFNWDERGRLWVAVTVDYPNQLQQQGQGNDRILICEDTNGDGRIDKIKVFAEGLSIPTSFVFAYGGLVVHCPPHTMFLRDKDGDDRADERQILITGWGTYDTHAGPSNLTYGLDNWIYGTVGYAGFQGRIAGELMRFGQGLYRFRLEQDPARPGSPPRVTQFEFLRSTTNNTWGLGISEEGEIFASTANGNPSVYLDIPNRYYEKVRGFSPGPLATIANSSRFYPITEKVRQVDFHGSFTAAAGHLLYTARTYPPIYWNQIAFVADPTGHLVASLVLERQGSGYRSRYGWNLVASDDEWCAPIAAAVGPDGNVWVIDWYSYIVQHNPTPPGFQTGRGNAYETPLRDKTRGRIYRLVQKQPEPLVQKCQLNMQPSDWVKLLRNDNLFWRMQAQRLLVEHGCRNTVPTLLSMLNDRSIDACGLNPGVIHALWTLEGLGVIRYDDEKVLVALRRLLEHPSFAVRKNTLQVFPVGPKCVEFFRESGVLKDPDRLVRKVAWLRLSDMPADRAAMRVLVEQFNDKSLADDQGLLDAYTIAASVHAHEWLPALADRKVTHLGEQWRKVLQHIAGHMARRHSLEDVRTLLSVLDKLSPEIQESVLGVWLSVSQFVQISALTDQDHQRIAELIERLPKKTGRMLLILAVRWNSPAALKHAKSLAEELKRNVLDESLEVSKRIESAQVLVTLLPQDDNTIRFLLGQITPQASPEWIEGMVSALAKSLRRDLGQELIKLGPTLTPKGRRAVVTGVLSRQDWIPALLEGLGQGLITVHDLSLEQRQSLVQNADRSLAARARKALSSHGGLPSPDRQKVIDSLSEVVKRKGNVEAGKIVFQAHCAKCHSYQGVGGKVGPDLTGMAVHTKEHLLAEILDPSRSVEGNYRQYIVATRSGLTLSGLLIAESKTAVELLDAEGKRHVISREEIEQLQASPKSLMPEGFEQQIKPQELADLLEFLTHRDKYIPLPLERWATSVSTKGMFYREDAREERLVFSDWQPKVFRGIPFHLVDPQGGRVANVIVLYSRLGTFPPRMPKRVELPCNMAARAIHMLSGVSGWGYPLGQKGSVSLIVRLHYQDGRTEDHELRNGEHFADYIRRVEVPGSEFAFALGRQQIRYLAIHPRRPNTVIRQIEFIKGPDDTAPIIMAVTVEASEASP